MIKVAALLCLFGIMGISGEPAGTCPSTHGTYVDFLTHKTDCTKFYKCNWGTPVLYDCPDGLHFNPTLNVCDWPERAGCSGAGNPSTDPTVPTDPTISPPASGDCDSVSCPAIPGIYPVFHAHPKDCGRYCKCDWGAIAHDMPCPDGLHFNTALNVCDWPAVAGCSGTGPSSTSTSSPIPTDVTTPETTIPTTTVTPTPGKCNGRVSCPTIPGAYPVFHAHPDDCGRYCKCDNGGIAHDMPCPTGLHFNTALNVCDWPANAGCSGTGTSSSTTPSPVPTDTTSPEITTTGTTIPTTTVTPTPGKCNGRVSCPAVPGIYPVFHAHPDDCGRYCKCDWNGVAHDMPCPTGLHFNTALNVCDWPADAGCSGSGSSTTTNVPDSTTAEVPTTTSTSAPGFDDCASVTCPAVNGVFPVFHSHPKVCDRYCKCDWGAAHDMPCPPGLHFNPTLEVCDYPWDAGCPHV